MKKVLVLGDSHVDVFKSNHMRSALPEIDFEVLAVGGATVSGLENPNSATQAMPQFIKALSETTSRTVIVMLGEVDTGFVIWYRSQKHETPIDDMLQQALSNYKKFVSDMAGDFKVICVSTPLPTIQDGMEWGEIANLRKEVKATQAERTALTLKFNKSMEEYCQGAGIAYLSLDGYSLDDGQRLKPSLRNSDPNDHHYDHAAHSAMIAPLLAPMLSDQKRRLWPFRWKR